MNNLLLYAILPVWRKSTCIRHGLHVIPLPKNFKIIKFFVNWNFRPFSVFFPTWKMLQWAKLKIRGSLTMQTAAFAQAALSTWIQLRPMQRIGVNKFSRLRWRFVCCIHRLISTTWYISWNKWSTFRMDWPSWSTCAYLKTFERLD